MTVQSKILAACLLFVAIIAGVGGLAQQQSNRMGRLAVGIYDHAFMGMSYVDQAQEEFLRLEAAHQETGETVVGSATLDKVMELLSVAVDRATSDRTRAVGRQTASLLTALANAPASERSERMIQADRSLTKLVKRFASDGLETRDNAEDLAARSTRLVLIQVAIAVCLALGVGWLVGRNLSCPLVQLVRTIDALAAGALERAVPARLTGRRDEIGALSRAANVFRDAMRQNARAAEDRERLREQNEVVKLEMLRGAADRIETETTKVAAQSAQSGDLLATRAKALAASAARMLISVDGATGASQEALNSCEIVAAAGEELSASAREIAGRIDASTTEIADTVRAGQQAHQIIGQLSASMGQIGSVARLIGDIAGRTNLLALNATIEAARAGDAGRGFAVVASEVKALATQTAHSTEDIARNIRNIETATQDAVKVVSEMVARVASIERITQAVAAAAEQQTEATGEIARSVLGTVASMRMVSEQIGSVTQEAHKTESAVTEMQSAAGTVAEQIAELRSVMVRIVRTSSDAANRRDGTRFPFDVPATLRLNGGDLPVTCLNLSLGGARLRAGQTLLAGTQVTLSLSGLPDLPGSILQDGKETSLRFAWEPDAAPAPLRDLLDRKAA